MFTGSASLNTQLVSVTQWRAVDGCAVSLPPARLSMHALPSAPAHNDSVETRQGLNRKRSGSGTKNQ